MKKMILKAITLGTNGSKTNLKRWNPWPINNYHHFDILASGKTDYHCKVKETLFIQELQSALNANVSSEKLLLY